MDTTSLWRSYGAHAATMLRAGPAPSRSAWPGAFASLSGAPHVDLNQAGVCGPGGPAEVEAIVALVADADVPCLFGVSHTVADRAGVSAILEAAGFERSPTIEYLFAASKPPAVADSTFAIRRVVSAEDHAAVRSILDTSHAYRDETSLRLYGADLLDGPDVAGWIAWDGAQPISCVFVTRVDGTLGVFDMTTDPAHRRRGAGRAVLTHALRASAALLPDGPAGGGPPVLFWSSPAGQPMYASIGFEVADRVDAWTFGATAEDLAAVGIG